MGLKDILASSKVKDLQKQIDELQALLTPEMRDLQAIRQELNRVQSQLDQRRSAAIEELRQLEEQKTELQSSVASSAAELNTIYNRLIQVKDEELYQSFGLYEPTFAFASSDEYSDALLRNRDQQKAMIKAGSAATGEATWTVNGNVSQGQKMVRDMQKLLLRAFNAECDELISKVRYSNFDSAIKRMTASRDAISKLGAIMKISISQGYFDLKIEELHIAFEYQLKKQEEKEEQKRIRAELREQARLAKEIEEARSQIEKEQKHYLNALKSLERQIEGEKDEAARALLLDKKTALEHELGELSKALADVDYRQANQRAGYVYVISNIGAFGEGVYKIGMTRRLDPIDRIDELSDASVPFDFDVHAMIFSDDAPKLEAALHKAFDSRKVNMVNQRREFFRVSLEEIEAVVRKNYDKTVDFQRIAPAEQYRITQKMLEQTAQR